VERGQGKGLQSAAQAEKPAAYAPSSTQSIGSTRMGGTAASSGPSSTVAVPSISAPQGGGAIKGIGEKFTASPSTGASSFEVPLPLPAGRGGFGPQLALQYNSGSGNSAFGLGWQLSLPAISRKTDKGVPRYEDSNRSDTFILAGAEDLVPTVEVDGPSGWRIHRYRPRVEQSFSRIERWVDVLGDNTHWRVTDRANVTSVFGASDEARISDPDNRRKVFSWLLQESRDDRGNVVCYVYAQENGNSLDSSATHDYHRFERSTAPPRLLVNSQKYIKRVFYGNKKAPDLSKGSWFAPLLPDPKGLQDDWCFEVVFDYGEHGSEVNPSHQPLSEWATRKDPFSSYRSGFEIRTYRLCQRVLLFHHFKELGDEPRCVRALIVTHETESGLSRLNSIETLGYDRLGSNYLIDRSSALPPLHLQYANAAPPVIRWGSRPNGQSSHLAAGAQSRWVDLDGEGIPGVLWSNHRGWFYGSNLGDGVLAEPKLVNTVPVHGDLQADMRQLSDLDGDGRLDLLRYEAPGAGFYARNSDQEWESERAIPNVPQIEWNDPNLRLIDLTGDGLADVLITYDDHLFWMQSKGLGGFEAGKRVHTGTNEDTAPRLVFADGTETIFLADMNGDGLTDIVRIRNGSVCYWPSLGYARFGARVVLSNCPRFDDQERFDPKRIRLSDIDGSGCADILYIQQREVLIYANLCGNALALTPQRIETLPDLHDTANLEVVDAFGHGTACLVWSAAAERDTNRPLQITDLTGGVKPHLLINIDNGYGGTTQIEYTTSTSQYLADKAQGISWHTRLPFPVHIIRKVVKSDAVAGTQLTTSYVYRHGYFDGVEREFRGFGFVEQRDAEVLGIDAELPSNHTAAVLTRTWLHTGAWLEAERLETAYAKEYYGGDASAVRLPDSQWPLGLEPTELREAARALKGKTLRTEVYGVDAEGGKALNPHPFTVTENAYEMHCLERATKLAHAVFHIYDTEALQYHYERDPTDPRATHELILAWDEFGNVIQRASVAYPRRKPAQPEQARLWATVSEACFTNDVRIDRRYRVGVPTSNIQYELLAISPTTNSVFSASEVRRYFADPAVSKRLISQNYQAYWADDLSKALPIGQIGSRALTGEQFALAFTDALLDSTLGIDKAANKALEKEPLRYGYSRVPSIDYAAKVPPPPAGAWFKFSGETKPEPALFFQATKHISPFGAVTQVSYDDYALNIQETTNPLNSKVRAKYDYRVLAPSELTDENGNVSQFAFDANGYLSKLALLGKGEGDSLAAPSKVFYYELNRKAVDGRRLPMRVRSSERVNHLGTRIQGNPASSTLPREIILYTDGSNREALTLMRAEPGEAPALDQNGQLLRKLDGTIALDFAASRWVASGRTVYTNKGHPVRKYEPFFWADSEFPEDSNLRQWGVSSVNSHDAPGRLVRVDHPDGTCTRIAFSAWHTEKWDENDTILEPLDLASECKATWYDLAKLGTIEQKRAAEQSARHKNTPHVEALDPLGRGFYAYSEEKDATGKVVDRFESRMLHDISGKVLKVFDAEKRLVAENEYDYLGRGVREWLADSGNVRQLLDASDQACKQWSEREFAWDVEYDALHRPTHRYVTWPQQFDIEPRADAGVPVPEDALQESPSGIFGWFESLLSPASNDDAPRVNHAGKTILAERLYYGEAMANNSQAQEGNFLGKLIAHFDDAGVLLNKTFDFKGNLTKAVRQLTVDFKSSPDWTALAKVSEPYQAQQVVNTLIKREAHTVSKTFDALNRVIDEVAPDGSLTKPAYNDAGLLEALQVVSIADSQPRTIITNIDYNARGQRTKIKLGCNVVTSYEYEPLRFRLTQLKSYRTNSPLRPLQNLKYSYDAVGNIVSLRDEAEAGHFFKGAVVEGHQEFTYDALYQLKEATGREHPYAPPSHKDPLKDRIPHPNDLQALKRYTERYQYDRHGNLTQVEHTGGSRWVRNQSYQTTNNHLKRVEGVGQDFEFEHDRHGNMISMPHLTTMHWDEADRLKHAARNEKQKVWFAYAADGNRVRKVFENQNTIEETIYLEGFQIYRRRNRGNQTLTFERQTLHVMDGHKRIAMLQTVTVDRNGSTSVPSVFMRFQLSNHLNSSSAELDENAKVVSYEEFHPFGTSSFVVNSAPEGAASRVHRFTAKERDSETGLDYFGARYFCPWFCRWISADPSGLSDGLNRYAYVRNNPIGLIDPDGRAATASDQSDFTSRGLNAIYGALNLVAAISTAAGLVASSAASATGVGAPVGIPGMIASSVATAYFTDKATQNFNQAIYGQVVDSGLLTALKVPLSEANAVQVENTIDVVGAVVSVAKTGSALKAAYDSGALAKLGVQIKNLPGYIRGVARDIGNKTGQVFRGANSGRVADSIVVTSRGVAVTPDVLALQGSSKLVGDFRGLQGAKVDEIISRIPSNWSLASQEKGFGVRFLDEIGVERLRLHGPSGNAPVGSNSASGWTMRVHVPDTKNSYFDNLGNVVGSKSNAGHIPIYGNSKTRF
jgi:RHS repeat-associated protein